MTAATEPQTTRRPFSIGGCIVWLAAAIMFVVFLAALLPNIAASYPIPYLSQFIATPQTIYSTSAPVRTAQLGAVPARQQPMTGGAAPWPTLTPTQEPVLLMLTLPPAPTPTAGFWTPAEQTQIAATATAFIEVIPTAPPAFVQYVDEHCKDPEVVAQSPTLQLFCKK